MSQTKHTPGPTDYVTHAGSYMPGQWVKEVNAPGQDGLELVAFVPNRAFGGNVVKRSAYVALLAAAPELLEALEASLELCILPDHTGSLVPALAKKGIGQAEDLARNTCDCPAHSIHRQIRAAIAKAEGRA